MSAATLTIRPYRGPEDLPHLAAIFNVAAEADGLQRSALGEQLAAWYAVPPAASTRPATSWSPRSTADRSGTAGTAGSTRPTGCGSTASSCSPA